MALLAKDSMMGGGREMICRHMESHYRRVSAVKGRVDSSAPEALLKSVRVRDRRKKEALVKNTKTKIAYLQSESQTTVLHTPNISQQEKVLKSPKWAFYHTKTGRTTAQYEELRRSREHRDEDPTWVRHPSPWKPAFDLQPLFKPDSPNGCSTPRTSPPVRRTSPSTASPRSLNVSSRLPTAEISCKTLDRHLKFNEQDDVTLFKDSIHFTHTIGLPSSSTEQHKQLPDFTTNSETGRTSPVMTKTQQITFHKTGIESSTVPHYKIHVAEKNFERRTMLGESVLELEYLKFVSAITRDILTKRQFSDAGIEVLIQSHVAANRHTLREDIMWQRITALRRDLGLIHTTATNYSLS